MKIFPAIDLKDGKVVRLYQGDYDQMTVYGDDPVSVAKDFYDKGARNLHVVDLDGAKDGSMANFDSIAKIAGAVDMFIEVGGGIRNEERIRQYLDSGVDRTILGTAAAKDPGFVERAIAKYGRAVAVGVDARGGKVAVAGWMETTELDSVEFCKRMRDLGVSNVIYTDIDRDGALEGTNLEIYRELREIRGLGIIASGGISTIEEIGELNDIVHGAIVGKALYDGVINLAECIEIAGAQ